MPEGFRTTEFCYDGITKTVFRRGDNGPLIVVMPEIPGVTPLVADFARKVADQGFQVALPSLFGVPDKKPNPLYGAQQLLGSCISKEFRLFAKHQASPMTDWVRALCRELHEELGQPKVGAIGMCITGNFALALMVEDWMMAPVLSQPSLPVGFGKSTRAALHISPEQLATAKKRCENDGVRLLGMRFTGDPLCPGERFETLRREFGEAFEGIEIDSSWGNPEGNPRVAHSVVTEHLVDREDHSTKKALDRVLAFFKEQLKD